MLFMLLAIAVSLLVAGGVVLYVAYPHRGERMPLTPWLGTAMSRAVEAAPVLDERESELLRSR